MPAKTSKAQWEKALGRKVTDAEFEKLTAGPAPAGAQTRAKSGKPTQGEWDASDAQYARDPLTYDGAKLYASQGKGGEKTIKPSLPEKNKDYLDYKTTHPNVGGQLTATSQAEYGGPLYKPPVQAPVLLPGMTEKPVATMPIGDGHWRNPLRQAAINVGNPNFNSNSQIPMSEKLTDPALLPEEQAKMDQTFDQWGSAKAAAWGAEGAPPMHPDDEYAAALAHARSKWGL